MRWVDYLDKEHGTTRGLDRPRLSDSAHNEYHSGDPSCQTCVDEGEIEVPVSQDANGVWTCDTIPCPDCRDGEAYADGMTTHDYPPFDPNQALFVGLAHYVAERDDITVDEAAERLVNLFESDEVKAQHEAEQANSPEAKLAKAQELLDQIRNVLG